MDEEEYARFICENASELSVPRSWSSFTSCQRQLTTNAARIVAIGGQRMIEHCAVVGGGVMGQGIVIAFLRAGYRTTLIERDEQTLARSIANIWRVVANDLSKTRTNKATITNAGQFLHGSTDFESIRDADFVVEAVFENTSLKVDVFRMLDRVCPMHAVLCTNTSTLDIETIAKCTSRPANVVGMHFFTPPRINQGLEIIYCPELTSVEVLHIAMAMGKKLEKIPVLMKNAAGFVANRMLHVYIAEALKLLAMGYTPHEVDTAFRHFGVILGPFQTLDLVGIDTWQRVIEENGWGDSGIGKLMVQNGRLGRKTGRGFYVYSDNHRHHDEELEVLFGDLRGRKERPALTQEEMVRMCMYPFVNEGFNILHDRIVERPESIDAMWVIAFAWPQSKGGPMYWAMKEGLRNILAYLEKRTQEEKDYPWPPSPLLKRIVNGTGNKVDGISMEKLKELMAKL